MINEERLRPMVKMAMFDKNDGVDCRPMIQYARTDYVSMELLKSFITGTIAFIILCVMWAMYDTATFLSMLNALYIKDFILTVAWRYVVFLVVYLVATYIVYQLRFSSGRKKVKDYYKNLKDMNKIYEREEHLKSSAQKD